MNGQAGDIQVGTCRLRMSQRHQSRRLALASQTHSGPPGEGLRPAYFKPGRESLGPPPFSQLPVIKLF